VKYGCESAKIEIHLKNDTREDVITRIFSKQGKSLWMINGTSVNIKTVQEFTANFNIQVCVSFCYYIIDSKYIFQ